MALTGTGIAASAAPTGQTEAARTLLLPGSLPSDAATLKALCASLKPSADVAALLDNTNAIECTGSWSDAEREALQCAGDLADGARLAHQNPALSKSQMPHQFALATPLHAALGLTDLTVVDSSTLSLTEEDSRALCAAADAHLREDGVQLHFVDTERWLVCCETTVDVLAERPEYLIGEALRPNLPRGKDGRLVERWMNELQMLLYTHPVNIAREDRGLPPVNVVWLWGFGASDTSSSPQLNEASCTEFAFAQALRNGDLPAWQAAWETLAPRILAADSIILGDVQPRIRLHRTQPSALSRLFANFKAKPTLANVLTALHATSMS
jgi:hypothetical protein